MIATNEKELSELFVAAILAITPRLEFKRAQAWRLYKRAVATPTTTRRFRLVWPIGQSGIQPRGAMAGAVIEHFAELRIRTDYAGEHAQQQHIIADDFHQLADVLSGLKANDNGLVLVERRRADGVNVEDTDVVKVDHIYNVRFMRRVQL